MLSDSSRSSRHCSVSFHRLLEQMHYTSAHLYSLHAYSRILTHIHACTLQNCATLACDMEPLAVAAASTDLTSARLQPGGCHFGRLTPIHAIAICAMLDMLASSNTWLAPATAYCREATRETVNQFAQGSGARQSKGGDRHRHQISARPYAHDSPPCGAVSFAAIVETHTSCMRISNYRHGTQRLSVCPRRQVPVTPMFRRCGVPRGLQAAPMSAVESDVTAPLS
jgi:hypothetical protein